MKFTTQPVSLFAPHLFLCQPHSRTSPHNHHWPCVCPTSSLAVCVSQVITGRVHVTQVITSCVCVCDASSLLCVSRVITRRVCVTGHHGHVCVTCHHGHVRVMCHHGRVCVCVMRHHWLCACHASSRRVRVMRHHDCVRVMWQLAALVFWCSVGRALLCGSLPLSTPAHRFVVGFVHFV